VALGPDWFVPRLYQLGKDGVDEYFNANLFIVALITYLGILLTFGVVFPPLAVVMCATMLSVAWQTKLSLGRFLHFAREQGAPQLVNAIESDCKGALSLELLIRSISLIMCFACCFYALFLFDTLGDAVGLRGAYWVLIVMPLFPLVLVAAVRVYRCWNATAGQVVQGPLSKPPLLDEVEMGALPELGSAVMPPAESRSDQATFNVLIDQKI
jgi:hypothetical protein